MALAASPKLTPNNVIGPGPQDILGGCLRARSVAMASLSGDALVHARVSWGPQPTRRRTRSHCWTTSVAGAICRLITWTRCPSPMCTAICPRGSSMGSSARPAIRPRTTAPEWPLPPYITGPSSGCLHGIDNGIGTRRNSQYSQRNAP
jgi:hypothetical protein